MGVRNYSTLVFHKIHFFREHYSKESRRMKACTGLGFLSMRWSSALFLDSLKQKPTRVRPPSLVFKIQLSLLCGIATCLTQVILLLRTRLSLSKHLQHLVRSQQPPIAAFARLRYVSFSCIKLMPIALNFSIAPLRELQWTSISLRTFN